MFYDYKPSKDKYIVFKTNDGGVGDRLIGAMNAFLLAYVNDYHFRIHEENNVPLVEIFTSQHQWWSKDWYEQPLKRGRLNMLASYDDMISYITEGTIEDYYPNSECIYFYSNQNMISYFLKNPIYKKKLDKLGVDKRTIYSEIFHYLFTLEDEYKKNFNYLKSKLFSNVQYVIGVHLRTNWNWSDVPQLSKNSIEKFINAINQNYLPNARVLISSDSDEAYTLVKNNIKDMDVVRVSGEAVHISKNKDSKINDLLKAIFEIYLLSECDSLIGSYWSNFTRLSVMRNPRKVILVELDVEPYETANQSTRYWIEEMEKSIDDVIGNIKESFRFPVEIKGHTKCDPEVLFTIK
jgi:hypothetical protein